MSPPKYQAIVAAQIPEIKLAGGAGIVRVIAGEFQGKRGPASTFTPINVWDVRLTSGRQVEVDLPAGHNVGVVVLEGRATVNGSPPLGDAEMALLDMDGNQVMLNAEQDSKLLLLSGAPLGEPVVAHGPFVMNNGEEIRQAIKDYQSGRMGHLS
jgi:redox-sensitive bicupin YhaK (pirin superfamily)